MRDGAWHSSRIASVPPPRRGVRWAPARLHEQKHVACAAGRTDRRCHADSPLFTDSPAPSGVFASVLRSCHPPLSSTPGLFESALRSLTVSHTACQIAWQAISAAISYTLYPQRSIGNPSERLRAIHLPPTSARQTGDGSWRLAPQRPRWKSAPKVPVVSGQRRSAMPVQTPVRLPHASWRHRR